MTTRFHHVGRVAAVAAVAVASVALITATDAAAEPATTAGFDVSYDDRVWGDFILAGNTQVRCVTAGDLDANDVDGDGDTTEPVGSAVGWSFYAECLTDATRDSFGTPQVPNDQRWMVHQNVDPGAGLFNSSSATIAVPPGATIASAELVWHGNNGEANSVGLNRTQIDLMDAGEQMAASGAAGTSPWPSCQSSSTVIDWGTYGTPVAWATAPLVAARQNAAWAAMTGRDRTQVQVQLGSGAGYQTVTSTSGQIGSPHMSGQLYQESADITDLLNAALPGDGSPLEITVGDIFTPEGFNCTGGWYTIVVWEYPTLNPTYAPELRRVQIWDGFAEVADGASESFNLNGFLAAPGWVVEPRAASVGYEGDQQIAGDSLLLNGLPVVEPRVSGGVATDNFYASTIGEFTNSTAGDFTRSNPEIRDAAGIDIKTVPVAAAALNSVLGGLPVTFQTAGDRYAASLFVFSAKEAVLSGTTYHDVDADGVFTPGVDTPIAGVDVTLTGTDDLGDPVSMTATTDENGFYVFVQVPASDLTGYTLTETQPANYLEGEATAGTIGGVVDTTNQVSGLVYDPIIGASGYDFGEIVPASIAGAVVDDSGNGIAGVDITLTGIDHDGSPVLIVVQTDANGDYLFDGLLPGTYVVTETQPLGYGDGVETAGSTGGDISTNDVIGAIVVDQGDASTGNDFAEITGSVSGSVVDQNGDPIADVSIALSGTDVDGAVAVTATTDANGDYVFDGLLAGTYTVTETQPAGYLDGDETAGSLGGDISTNDVIAAIPLLGGQDSIDNDFAEFQPSTIAGSVVDQNGVGIAGVEITLSGTSVNGDVVTLTTTTDADGDYSFTDLLPGTYVVTETQPAGYLDGDETAGSLGGDISTNDVIAAIALDANQSSTDNDFAEYQPASISGSVVDDFGNGIAGVEIVLSGTDVNGGPVSASTTTDANGDYSFTNLLPGAYDVAETQPTGFSDGAEAAGSTGGDISTNDVIADIPLAGGQNSVDNDFAEYRPSGIAGSVVDQDDVGIADVTLTLTGTDVNGDPVSLATTTDADGNYLFGDLLPGTYTVTETHPSGYLDGHEEAGSTGGDISTNDVIADIPLQANESSYGHDFHEFVPASIEGSVFVDGDGEPIAGVVITLTGTNVNGNPVEIATTTDTDGDYSFVGLLPGSYVVTETQPDGYGAGAVTPNNSISIELSGGDESTDNDFSESTGSISGTVTDDQGRPLVDVEITLTGTDVNGVDIELVTTTNSTGDYVFGDVVGGDYTVTETQPDGYGPGVSAAGSTGGDDGVNDIVGIELPGGVDSVDNDFVEETSTVSGVVRDDDGNPIAGVDVSLNGTDVNGDLVAQSTTTGSDGSYVFPGIVAGSYTISQTQPNGYSSVIAIPGSTGGSVDGTDIITSVTVGDGEDSEDNDFVETRTATRTVTERELPLTGGSAGDLARVAMLLALIGGVLLLAGRRRREGDIA